MEDVVEKDGFMTLARRPVLWTWAMIDAALNIASFLTPQGYAYKESRDAWRTHRILIRAQSGIEPTSAAWIYEWRRKSPPRWYKLLDATESDAWIFMLTHLIERSDKAQPPIAHPLVPMPSNVKL
jgi:hypothetical protein